MTDMEKKLEGVMVMLLSAVTKALASNYLGRRTVRIVELPFKILKGSVLDTRLRKDVDILGYDVEISRQGDIVLTRMTDRDLTTEGVFKYHFFKGLTDEIDELGSDLIQQIRSELTELIVGTDKEASGVLARYNKLMVGRASSEYPYIPTPSAEVRSTINRLIAGLDSKTAFKASEEYITGILGYQIRKTKEIPAGFKSTFIKDFSKEILKKYGLTD